MDIERRFVAAICDWLVSLPHDLKLLYDAAIDPNLERAAREIAIGAIIYVISPSDGVTVDRKDFAIYADDAILLHLAAKRVIAKGGPETDVLRERFSEVYEDLDEHLRLCEQVMGDTYGWLSSKLDTLGTLTYKGKKVAEYLDDDEASEFLYEEGMGFGTNYPVDENTLHDRVKKASTIMDSIERRRAEEDRRGA